MRSGQRLLEVKGLQKQFPMKRGFFRRVVGAVHAVEESSFHVDEGETLGLVGESGCGKTTTLRCILGILKPSQGQILFRTRAGQVVDLAGLGRAQMRPFRREMQMIFQDPFSSLNPRMTVFDIVGEPLYINGLGNRQERMERVAALLRLVGLSPACMRRFPHAFSGGERQRIGIARALALQPRFIVADEPVSALDVSIQAQIINLLLELQDELHLTYLFTAHDLNIVRHFCDRVAVMYLGRIVEVARTEELFAAARHPYTAVLLSAIPAPHRGVRSWGGGIVGEVPSPAQLPSGCVFHPRCSYTIDICRVQQPALVELSPGHGVRCHRAHELWLDDVVDRA